MLAYSPEMVQRKISSALGIFSIDNIRVDLNKELKELRNSYKDSTEKLTSTKLGIIDREKALNLTNEHYKSIKGIFHEWDNKNQKLQNLNKHFQNLNHYSPKKLEEVQLNLERIQNLESKIEILEKLNSLICSYNIKYEDMLNNIINKIQILKDKTTRFETLYNCYREVKIKKENIEGIEYSLQQNDLFIEEVVEEINKLQEGICPTCGRSLNE